MEEEDVFILVYLLAALLHFFGARVSSPSIIG
jgi:hypothetical protein